MVNGIPVHHFPGLTPHKNNRMLPQEPDGMLTFAAFLHAAALPDSSVEQACMQTAVTFESDSSGVESLELAVTATQPAAENPQDDDSRRETFSFGGFAAAGDMLRDPANISALSVEPAKIPVGLSGMKTNASAFSSALTEKSDSAAFTYSSDGRQPDISALTHKQHAVLGLQENMPNRAAVNVNPSGTADMHVDKETGQPHHSDQMVLHDLKGDKSAVMKAPPLWEETSPGKNLHYPHKNAANGETHAFRNALAVSEPDALTYKPHSDQKGSMVSGAFDLRAANEHAKAKGGMQSEFSVNTPAHEKADKPHSRELPDTAAAVFHNASHQGDLPFEAQLTARQAVLANRPVRDAVLEQLLDKMELQSLPDGEKNLYVRLKPAVLGAVEIRLKLEAGQLVASVLTDNQQVKQLLEASLPQLRQRLEQQQLVISAFTVSVGQEHGQPGKRPWQQQDRNTGQAQAASELQVMQVHSYHNHAGLIDLRG